MKNIELLFDRMWQDYIKLTPQAQKIVELLEAQGETVQNDHIALRTFDLFEVSIDKIAAPFLAAGFEEKQTYDFEAKKLFAKHYEHPNPKLPKVFISELLTQKFSPKLQKIVKDLVDQIPLGKVETSDFMLSATSWELSSTEYEALKEESEYAAWMAAIGYRPNHFTIFINNLKKFNEVKDLNDFLKANGFNLNDSGGEVKGSPAEFLEQSSTLADTIEVQFSDKTMMVPSCYFEFAKRYALPNGKLYQGFVAKSADKIFESTDKTQ